MVFDPSTARPERQVQPIGGFDISTAQVAPQQPIQQPEVAEPSLISPERFIGRFETLRTIGSAGARAFGGGVAGIAQALTPGAPEFAGAETARIAQEEPFQPTTEAGKRELQKLNDLVQRGIDIFDIPLAGVGAILELVSGQGIDKAVETIQAIRGGAPPLKRFGERVFEETGEPLAATVAEVGPEALLAATGIRTAAAAPRVAGRVAGEAGEVIGRAVAPTAEALTEISKGIFQFQTPTKQRIARAIAEGSTDVETARFRLAPGEVFPEGVPQPQRTRIQEFLDIGGPRVQTDRVAVESIRQGFDEGVIAAIKGAPAADKAKMLQMVNIMERGKKNKRFAIENRPSDIAGDSLMDRFRIVSAANKRAGQELDVVAKSLVGSPVDLRIPIGNFADSLDSLGINLVSDGKGGFKPSFENSIVSPGDRGPLKEVIRQMNRLSAKGKPDANDAHTLKRIIDSNVTFGKTKTGLSGDTSRVLKNFRREIDSVLDENFPEYNRVNTTFSETIGAIDALQDVAGRSLNLTGPNADKAVGTLLRRLMSNAQSRVRLLDSVNELETIARKHAGRKDIVPFVEGVKPGDFITTPPLSDDLLTQILFVDELDSVFGPVARTSFQGQIDQALKQGIRGVTTRAGAADVALDVAGRAAERVRGINEEGAFSAIKDLLRQQQ